MAVKIPFITSETNYRLICPIDDEYTLIFDVRWNSRDEGWYVDIYEENESIISLNEKLVAGARLGRISRHKLFYTHIFRVVDTSRSGTDPGFDDLNARVELVVQSVNDPL